MSNGPFDGRRLQAALLVGGDPVAVADLVSEPVEVLIRESRPAVQEQHRRRRRRAPSRRGAASDGGAQLRHRRTAVVPRRTSRCGQHDVAIGAVEDHARGHHAELVQRQGDRGQVDEPRRARVVDAGDRDATRHVDARAAQARQQADRDLVVDGQHRVRQVAAREQQGGGGVAGLVLESARRAGPARRSPPPSPPRSPRAGARSCAAPAGPRRTRSAGGRATAGAPSRRAPRPRLSTSTLGQSKSRVASATTAEPAACSASTASRSAAASRASS